MAQTLGDAIAAPSERNVQFRANDGKSSADEFRHADLRLVRIANPRTGLAGCPDARAMVSSAAIGHLRPKSGGGTMRSVRSACRRGVVMCCRLAMLHRRASRSRAASSGSITATVRAAPRSTRARPIRSTFPFMPVFNNLVIFNQDVAQNSVRSIVPDLAESWAWSERQQDADLQAAAGRQMA